MFHLTILAALLATCQSKSDVGSLSAYSERTGFNSLQEYCSLETFRPGCWKNEVVVIKEAIYGRRRVGKCLGSEEANTFQDPRYFGCSENVLHIVDAKCSGRKDCEISIPDPDLDGTTPCLPGLKMFLEVSYTCVEVVEPDRSCVVSVTSSPLHIAAAAAAAAAGVDSWSTQSNIGCGTKTQPWTLEAPAGQRINISLLDFTAAARLTSQHLTRSTSHIITSSSSSSSGSCVDENHQYGYIIDKSSVNKKNVSVCHARSNRQTHVYLSTSNVVEVVLISPGADQHTTYVLQVIAVGCTNLIPPEDAWIKREDDKIIIGCYTSRQTWQLRCHDGRWTGVVSNCSQDMQIGVNRPLAEEEKQSMTDYEVLIIVAVSFAGLAICLTIICCGLVCLKRYYSSCADGVKCSYGKCADVMTLQRSAPATEGVMVTSQYNGGVRRDVMSGDRQYFVLEEDTGSSMANC